MEKINNPEVSIIIPAYNASLYLQRAIESVLKQTFENFELIIVNDGSIDNTEDIVKRFQKKDKRIRYIQHDKNRGSSEARNTGIKTAKGKYVAFLDSDDEWLENKLEKQLEVFKNPQINVVTCWAYWVDEIKNKTSIYAVPYFDDSLPYILRENYLLSNPSGVVLKKSVIKKVGLFDNSLIFVEDWDYWIRIIENGYNFYVISQPLLKYFFSKGNLTNTLLILKKAQNIEKILQKHKQYYKKYSYIYALKLRELGHLFCLGGDLKNGRKYLQKAIFHNSYKAILNFFISLFGKNFYLLFFSFLNKIKN
jgi:glycosyltransferase involved in cell wall biosynthesis